MTKHPVALAIALAFATSAALSGCDRITNLTEQEHIQRAKDFEDKGDVKASIVELKNAIQKNPESPQARLLLGQLYLKAGMGDEAEKELTKAKKLGVSQETINPQLGEALLLTGEYRRVLDEIQPGEQTSKANLARIMQLRADALLKLGQLQDACNLFQKSLNTDPNNAPTYWGLAHCAVAERDMAKARKWLNTALEIKNRQAKTWILIGELEQNFNNNIEAALAAYSNALKLEPGNLEALRNRAAINTRFGNMKNARIDIEKINKLAPESLYASYLQALLKFKENKYSEARDAVQESIKKAPDYVPALMLGGTIEYRLDNLQTAESHFNKVVRTLPRNPYAIRMLAATQLRLGRPDDAAKTLGPFDLEKVTDTGILAIAGEIATAKKEFSKAAYYFEKAAEFSPNNAALRSELGMARLAQGDSRAMADLHAAAAMEGSDSQIDNVIILNQLKQKQFDAALISIAELEKKQPQSPLPWNYRGMAYLGKNDVAKARHSLEQALKLEPKFLPAAAILARLDILNKEPEAARKRFESILENDKSNVGAMMALADLAATQNQEKSHVDWLEKAVKADPKNIVPSTGLVQHYLAKNESQKAQAIARETLNANPDSIQAMNLLGATQLASGNNSDAIDTFNRITLKSPQSPDAYLNLALAQITDKQIASARNSLKKAIQLKSDFNKAHDALLRLELTEKNPEAALQIARQIQIQQPGSPYGFDREGDILLSQNKFPQAIKAYELALSKGAGSGGVIKLHRALHISGASKSAEQRLQEWLKKNPKDISVRNYAAEFYMATLLDRDAIAQYEEVIKLAPQNVVAHNNLAILYQKVKDSRALSVAEQAYKLEPDNPHVLDTLGWILVEQGRMPRALELLNKAVTKSPNNGSFRYHYGVALARTGKKAEAKKELKAAIAHSKKSLELEQAKALLKDL